MTARAASCTAVEGVCLLAVSVALVCSSGSWTGLVYHPLPSSANAGGQHGAPCLRDGVRQDRGQHLLWQVGAQVECPALLTTVPCPGNQPRRACNQICPQRNAPCAGRPPPPLQAPPHELAGLWAQWRRDCVQPLSHGGRTERADVAHRGAQRGHRQQVRFVGWGGWGGRGGRGAPSCPPTALLLHQFEGSKDCAAPALCFLPRPSIYAPPGPHFICLPPQLLRGRHQPRGHRGLPQRFHQRRWQAGA